MIVNISIPLIQKKILSERDVFVFRVALAVAWPSDVFCKGQKIRISLRGWARDSLQFPCRARLPPPSLRPRPPAQHLWHLIMESISSLFEPEKIDNYSQNKADLCHQKFHMLDKIDKLRACCYYCWKHSPCLQDYCNVSIMMLCICGCFTPAT